MSTDLPRLPLPVVHEVGLAEKLAADAERERRQAQRYRRLGWVFATPAMLSLPCCIVGLSSGLFLREDSFVLAVIVLLLQAAVSPAVALILFARAARHRRQAARCVQATMPPVEGADLLGQAESSRRASLRWEWLWPIVLMWGLLGAAGFVVLVLVGIDSLAFFFEDEGIILLLMAAIVIAGPAWLLHRRVWALRRRADLIEACARLGFSYREKPFKGLLAAFGKLPLFRRGGEAAHLMQGELDGHPVSIMEYRSGTINGPPRWQTVVVVGLSPSCVAFRLWPASVAAGVPSRIAVAVKQAGAIGQDESVPNDLPPTDFTADGLENRWWLFSHREDRGFLEAVLTGDVASFLKQHPDLAVETDDGLMTVYQPGVVWEPGDHPRRLDAALTLCDRLGAALNRQNRRE